MRRRIIVCLGLLLALCVAGDVAAMACLYQTIGQLSRVADSHRIQSMRADLASSGVRIESDLLAYLDGHRPDPQRMELGLQRFLDSEQQCVSCHHETSTQEYLDALHTAFVTYQTGANELFARDAGRPGRSPINSHHPPWEQHLETLADRVARQAMDLAGMASTHLSFQSVGVEKSVRNAWIWLFGTLVAALTVGGFVAFHLERRLTLPVASLLEGIDRAREGAVPQLLPLDADQEFQTLARAFEHAYQSLDTARAKMIQTEKMAAVGRLAAGVAHEVGNPLASISSIAQVMRRQSPAEGQGEQLDLIMEEIGRISRIIRELLTFSRPEQGASYEHVDVGAVLDRATTLLGYDKRAKGVRLACHYEKLPTVWGSADQLLLVFTNVILNAFDAMSGHDTESGTLTITNSCQDGQVVVRFEDNGPGMNTQQLANAFEPFYTTKEPGEGTGLGLWVCYRVVQQHEGTIELKSSEGTGTTVTVKLPCQPEESPVVAGSTGV